ncbi:MAG: polysaccharide deacetylase family protein [Planctomycetes bacterium]|nr:polysaccharide deacetylase family protein [Planctomycetota bacterium]
MPAPWTWPNRARAAVSLTYDDGDGSLINEAMPDLEAVELRGTFYLHVGRGDVKQRAADWQAAHKRGHEIGNHTVRHAGRGEPYMKAYGKLPDWMPLPLEKFTPKMIDDEVTAAADWLRENIGPDPDRTFAYPCGAVAIGDPPDEKSYDAAVLRHHFAARVGGADGCVNDPLAVNFLRIASSNGDHYGGDVAPLIKPCEQAVAVGGWAVIGFHGIGGTNPTTERAAHKTLIAHLHAGPYWVAPVKTVARYVQTMLEQSRKK